MFLSSTVKFVVLMVVVEPLTVRFPVTVRSVPIKAEPAVSNCTVGEATPIPILSLVASTTSRLDSPVVAIFKSVVSRLSVELNICPVILPIAILYQFPTLLVIFIHIDMNTQIPEQHLLKYAVRIPLPDTLRNRPLEEWSQRPDLNFLLKETIDQLESVLFDTCESNFVVASDEIQQNSIDLHFETQEDKARFLAQWPYAYQKIKVKNPKYAVSWLEAVEA